MYASSAFFLLIFLSLPRSHAEHVAHRKEKRTHKKKCMTQSLNFECGMKVMQWYYYRPHAAHGRVRHWKKSSNLQYIHPLLFRACVMIFFLITVATLKLIHVGEWLAVLVLNWQIRFISSARCGISLRNVIRFGRIYSGIWWIGTKTHHYFQPSVVKSGWIFSENFPKISHNNSVFS